VTIEWPRVRLGDCVELVAGFAFKSNCFTNREEDVHLVKGENVGQGRVLWEISKRWPASDCARHQRFQLDAGDVIVAMDRPWVPAGLKWAVIRSTDPRALLVQRVARLRANGRMEQAFLPFIVGGPDFEDYIRPIVTGVNVPHVSGKQILDFAFELPPLQVQRRIVELVSSYDD